MEVVVVYSQYYPDICLEKLRGKMRKTPSVMMSGVPCEDRTQHVPNRCPEPYLQANLLRSL
jgi:hypothetical protein